MHKSRESFEKTFPRRDVLKMIEKEASAFRGRDVQLCFISDPYCHADTNHKLTREVIRCLLGHGVIVSILTKGGKRSERDFDLLSAKRGQAKYGTTLTCILDADSLKWEPDAALPQERIDALKKAHSLGIKTWVSCEPVIYPEQTLELIERTAPFVNLFKVGTMNYHEHGKTIDWSKFARDVVSLFRKLNISNYYMKNDLKAYLK